MAEFTKITTTSQLLGYLFDSDFLSEEESSLEEEEEEENKEPIPPPPVSQPDPGQP